MTRKPALPATGPYADFLRKRSAASGTHPPVRSRWAAHTNRFSARLRSVAATKFAGCDSAVSLAYTSFSGSPGWLLNRSRGS